MNDDLFHFMDANNDNTAPDGAWWAALENAVEIWNTVHCYLIELRKRSDNNG